MPRPRGYGGVALSSITVLNVTPLAKSTICVECNGQFVNPRVNQTVCSRECRDRRQARRVRLANFGLSLDDYDRMWEGQDGRCAICGVREDRLDKKMAIDHDHSCCAGSKACGACVRGLLCGPCNLGLGAFSDDARRLRLAADYIDRTTLREARLLTGDWGSAWVGSEAA